MNDTNYHGLWIPKSILTDKRLSKTEMLLYSIVDALDNASGCYASNAYLGEQLGLDERNIRANLMRLEQAGYIIRMENGNGKRRIQTVANKTLRDTKVKGHSPQSIAECFTAIDANPSGEDAGIRGEDANIRGGGCNHPPYNIEDSIDSINNPLPPSKSDDVKGLPKVPAMPYPSQAFAKAWGEWVDYRKELKKKLTPKTIQSQFKMLAGLKSEALAIQSIERSISCGWTGIFPPTPANKSATTKNQHTNGF